MRLLALALLVSLTACGGGGGSSFALAPISTDPTPTVEITLSATAPHDNLLAASNTLATASTTSLCNYAVGSSRIIGTVSAVHDGDTITVNGTSIRLDSIDAPELAQTYGKQSQQTLSAFVLGKPVTVAYTKTDKYGRIVGSVFTSTCQYVNLSQVAAGSAWFYRAYQCEIASSSRNAFAAAEDAASAGDTGLWAGVATPPWVYRNGEEPPVPVCSSDSPSWVGNAPGAVTGVTLPIVTPPDASSLTSTAPLTPSPVVSPPVVTVPNTGCFMVWVNGYTRANGTRVNGYFRKSPGCP